MAMKIPEKVKDALDEGRILLLGTQIIIGFQWRTVFENGYEKLPWPSQCLGLIALVGVLLQFGLLVTPVCYHKLVAAGEDTNQVHLFATRATEAALIPFTGTLGIDLYLTSSTLVSLKVAVVIATGGLLVALFFWFMFELFFQRQPTVESEPVEPTPLSTRIDHTLTEARMVLPGAQALLGFQFIIFFSESFQKIPQSSRFLHLASLLLVCFAVILLMTPAAFHRIVERGEDTERFYRIATRLVLSALVPIALASSAELYIVVAKVTENIAVSVTIAILLLVCFLGLWFVYPLILQRRSLPRPLH